IPANRKGHPGAVPADLRKPFQGPTGRVSARLHYPRMLTKFRLPRSPPGSKRASMDQDQDITTMKTRILDPGTGPTPPHNDMNAQSAGGETGENGDEGARQVADTSMFAN